MTDAEPKPQGQAYTKNILGAMIRMERDDKIISFRDVLCFGDHPDGDGLLVALGAPEMRRVYRVPQTDILVGSKAIKKHKRGVLHIHSRSTIVRDSTGIAIPLLVLLSKPITKETP